MAFLLHQLLTEVADHDPGQPAVVSSSGSLTYGELDALSNQVAHQLRADGVRAGDRVGMFLPKSIYAVAALFGIQKAGAASVPIDPHSPAQRAMYILQDCGVKGLVTTAEKLACLPGELLANSGMNSILLSDDLDLPRQPPPGVTVTPRAGLAALPKTNPSVPVTDNDLAYILYTSGSTGKPKGVMISHLNALTFVNWCYSEFGVQKSDRVSSHAPFHFDLSVFDLYCTIKAGGTVYLVPSEVQAFPRQLARWIADQEISIWYSVPSALIQLVDHGNLESLDYKQLRLVLFAGEVFPIKYLRELVQSIPGPSYYNLYGPTETNVCTYYRVKESDIASDRTEPVSIGIACANTEVFAVDEQMQPIATGQQGELYVRSGTVMKGYWGRPEATTQVVVQNFMNSRYSEVIYRTGDIVSLLPSGDYQYVGRRDKMIKSRGYRIELGEIEASLYSHPQVREVAVVTIADEQIGARIAAYVVCDGDMTRHQLERHCREALPRYMVPERFEIRNSLPKTSTGKIDRPSLEQEMERYARGADNGPIFGAEVYQ